MSHRMASPSLLALLCVLAAGCASDSHAGCGALFGGLLGAGTGAVIGHAAGNTAAGAAIGAGVGALSGAAIGAGQDEVEAHNRAMIEAQMGRRVAVGAVTVQDVITMVQQRVHDDLIINHIRSHGMVAQPTTGDLIALQQAGVSPAVVQVMQACPPMPPPPQTVIVEQSPPPVVVGGYWGPYYHHRHYYGW
jgi:hypothetical protein